MNYKKLTKDLLDLVIKEYIDYYNEFEEGIWTYDLAYKKITQIMTIEDSLCLVQYDGDRPVGFLMAYYMTYDDLVGLFIDEILIFKDQHRKGYGRAFMTYVQDLAKKDGASMVELISVNDRAHLKFYRSLGYYKADNLVLMGKDLE